MLNNFVLYSGSFVYYAMKLQVLFSYSAENRFFCFLLAGNQPALPRWAVLPMSGPFSKPFLYCVVVLLVCATEGSLGRER